jgi:diguanylate cyclase (GGDEF)-like protein
MSKANGFDALAVLAGCFSTVLQLDAVGTVVDSFGTPLGVESAIDDMRLSAHRDAIESCLNGQPFESWIVGPAGRQRLSGHPLPNGMALCLGHPVPASSSGTRVRSISSELEFLVQNMRQGIWRLNSRGAILYANDYLANWLEVRPDELIGQSSDRYLNRADYGDAGAVEGGARFEAEFVTKSGIRRRAIVATTPLFGPKGRFTGTLDVITDVTAEHAVRAKLVEEVQRMSALAATDALTGLSNRHRFNQVLRELQTRSNEQPFAVIVADVDGFKEINDTLGHEAGDRALVETSVRLRQGVRESDLVARIGGDEFAVLLPGAYPEEASEIMDRLKERLSFMVSGEDASLPVQISLGLSHSRDGTEGMVRSADRRMYRAKRRQR